MSERARVPVALLAEALLLADDIFMLLLHACFFFSQSLQLEKVWKIES